MNKDEKYNYTLWVISIGLAVISAILLFAPYLDLNDGNFKDGFNYSPTRLNESNYPLDNGMWTVRRPIVRNNSFTRLNESNPVPLGSGIMLGRNEKEIPLPPSSISLTTFNITMSPVYQIILNCSSTEIEDIPVNFIFHSKKGELKSKPSDVCRAMGLR